MALVARDVMQSHVIKLDPDTPLLDVHRLFVEEGIGGAPVVDEMGKLIGVVSSADLLRAVEEERDTAASTPNYLREFLEFSGPDWTEGPEDFQDRLSGVRVSDVMTPGGVSVAPDAPISEVARRMREQAIHRVFVVEGESLEGVITTFDMVGILEKVEV